MVLVASSSVSTMVQENLTKFIIGQRPLSDWEAFQAELAAQPIDEILAIYDNAYNKIK